MWKEIKPLILNRYTITIVVALVWMLFLDQYDVLSQYKVNSRIQQMEADKQFFENEIDRIKKDRLLMQNNPHQIERFARENYVLKRDNEDLFIFVKPDSSEFDK